MFLSNTRKNVFYSSNFISVLIFNKIRR